MKANLKNYIQKLIFIFKQLLKSGPSFLIFVVVAVLINGLSPVFTAFLVSKIIAILEVGHLQVQYVKLFPLVALMLVSVILSLFTSGIKTIISELTSQRLSYNIQTTVAAKFQKIPQSTIDTPNFQNLYRNTSEKVLTEPMSVAETLFSLISTGIGMLGYMSIISMLNIFSLVFIIGLTIPIYFIKGKSRNLEFDFLSKHTTKVRQVYYNYYLMSDSQVTKEIRTFSLFRYLKAKREKVFNTIMRSRQDVAKKRILYLVLTTLLSLCGALFTEFVLIKDVINGFIPVSQFVLYNTAITSLVTGLFTFVDLIVLNKKSLQFMDFLFEFLKLPTEMGKATEKSILHTMAVANQTSSTYEIEFKNVSFKYPGAVKNSVENVSFKFCTGEKICLVGENGSGKSTLAKLLLRIYEPSEGSILINGIDVKNYDLEVYRKMFGVIFQDFIRYYANIQENIGFGDVDEIENMEKIKAAAHKTNSDEFIENYKDGYKTNLGKLFYDDAIEPSGGQWQKLAISRAFFPSSKVLVLDEPTAALDPKAEDEIFKMFHTYENDKAVFMISHRMCSAKLADKIILLSGGKILEQGSHTELMDMKQNYYEMYTLQADKYA